MLRPVAYFYQITHVGDPLPTGKTPLAATGDRWIYDVHSIGNPALWWLSTLAIALTGILVVQSVRSNLLLRKTSIPRAQSPSPSPVLNPTELWLGLFILINHGANLLPWVRVTRCVFLYHYMGSSMFGLLGIAWLCDRWLCSHQSRLRNMGITTVFLIAAAFIFWMPIYLGLPLSPLEFKLRMWLPSWI
jgi:dolichyl-phosphate-mannose-protein mannosyltransferase